MVAVTPGALFVVQVVEEALGIVVIHRGVVEGILIRILIRLMEGRSMDQAIGIPDPGDTMIIANHTEL